MKKRFKITVILCIALCMVMTGCGAQAQVGGNTDRGIELSQVPEYSGQPYVAINNNEPELMKQILRYHPLKPTAALTVWADAAVPMPI